MNTKSSNLKKALYIIISLTIFAVVVLRLKSNKETSKNNIYQYDKEKAIYVQADTLQLENVNEEFSFAGTFEPIKETKISAEIQGKINEILVDVGSFVNKGQSLIQLDNSLLKLQLQTIDVQIEGLQSDVNRYSILAKADAIKGVELEKFILGLKSANIQKATLVEQINKTTIKAPFSGVITAKLSEEGAYAALGIPLLQITDITNLKFTINISENELVKFKLNQRYSITADAYSDISLSGETCLIGSKANLGSIFPVQFNVINTSDLKIKAGMFGKVYISNATLKNSTQDKRIIISSSAIVGTAAQPQVYLIENGKSILHNITILKKTQNKSIVSNGLKAGDVIVTNGFINLYDGANIFVK